MQTTVRTTIRIRKDLLDQSRLLALKQGTSLQEIINEVLLKGFDNHITDFDLHQQAMKNIDRFRESFKGKKINVNQLVEKNKQELEERTNRLIGQ